MIEYFVHLLVEIIEAGGYAGVFFLMMLESMVAPVPSEAVLPFAGFLIFSGKMSLLMAVAAGTAGSVAGSLLSYYMGFYGGQICVKKYGKYLLLNEEHLLAAEKFFARFGDKTIFISRFIPVIRHFISIPAGIGKMNLKKFIAYTAIGAGLWNFFLTYLGYCLDGKWEEIRKHSEVLDKIIIALIILFGIFYAYKFYKSRKSPKIQA